MHLSACAHKLQQVSCQAKLIHMERGHQTAALCRPRERSRQQALGGHNTGKGQHLEQEQHSVQLAGLRCGVQGRRAAVRGHRRVRAGRQQLLHDLPAACAPPCRSLFMSSQVQPPAPVC